MAKTDKTLIRNLRVAADNTFKKDRRINIRLSERDMAGIQRVAAAKGMPYQSFISGLISCVTEELLGFGQDPVDLAACLAMVHVGDLKMVQDMLARVLEHGEIFGYNMRILIPEREIRWLRVSNSPLRNDAGDIVGAVGTIIDCTTEHQQAEQHRLALETA